MARTHKDHPLKFRNAELAVCQPGSLRTRVVGAKRGGGRKVRPRNSNRVNKEQGC